jgi:hypothetical protein
MWIRRLPRPSFFFIFFLVFCFYLKMSFAGLFFLHPPPFPHRFFLVSITSSPPPSRADGWVEVFPPPPPSNSPPRCFACKTLDSLSAHLAEAGDDLSSLVVGCPRRLHHRRCIFIACILPPRLLGAKFFLFRRLEFFLSRSHLLQEVEREACLLMKLGMQLRLRLQPTL